MPRGNSIFKNTGSKCKFNSDNRLLMLPLKKSKYLKTPKTNSVQTSAMPRYTFFWFKLMDLAIAPPRKKLTIVVAISRIRNRQSHIPYETYPAVNSKRF